MLREWDELNVFYRDGTAPLQFTGALGRAAQTESRPRALVSYAATTLGTPIFLSTVRRLARSAWFRSRQGGRDGPPGRPQSSKPARTGGASPAVCLAMVFRNWLQGHLWVTIESVASL